MYQNNYYQQPFGNGYYQMQAVPQPTTLNNPLTKEQLELLKQRSDKLTLTVTPLEMAKAICTHKQGNSICLYNQDSLNPERVTCSICGETFDLTNGDQAAVEGAVELITNIIQTIKTYWLDVPTDVAQNLFSILPLIQKLPRVYSIASKCFSNVQDMHRMSESQQPYGFGMLNNIMNPMFAGYYGAPGYGYPQQPVPQPSPYGQPVFPNPIGGYQQPQQPMAQPQQMGGFVPQPNPYAMNPVMMPNPGYQAPTYQDPANAGVNPFGFNAPTMPQQPMAQPQAPAAPQQGAVPPVAANGVPAPSGDAVNEKVFSV